MYDPKFEKAIQQKMEELEFRPAESVWVNIEKAVVDKRRRRAGYFWRFMLPGVVLVGIAGASVFYHGQAGKPRAVTSAEGKEQTTNGRRMDHPANPATDQPTGHSTDLRTNPATDLSRDPATDRLTAHSADRPADHRTPPMTKGGFANGSNASIPNGSGRSMTSPMTNGTSEVTDEAEREDVTSIGNAATATSQDRVSEWFYLPGLADQKFGPQVQGSALKTKKTNLISLTKLSHPKSRWEAGFVAGGGLSRLNRLNADRARDALSANATSLYAIASPSSSKHYISNTSPGASFDGGIYLQKALSDRWIINTGMNLHYYSNHISIGQQVSTNVPVSASLFLPTAAVAVAQTTNSTMYSAGNAQHFTNQYYFLELPVGLQWKVTRSHMLPIFLEGGVSLSRLMGASALFYDAKTGLYSKNAVVVDKTQFNVSSSLMVGLPFHGIAIQLGPQVQYGLTPLVNTQGLGDQHLFYTGLRVVVIPGRK